MSKKIKIATLLVVSVMFVSCSSKTKTATTKTATTEAAKKDAAKKGTDAKPTKQATAPSAGSLVCKNGSDTRSLEVVTKDGGCELSYTKFDQTSTPASSANGTAHCENVKEKVKGNLEAAGFKCE